MSAKHTPGPWRTKTGAGWNDSYIVGKLVGAVEPTISTVRANHVDHEQHLSNARLIAAAPELLDALQDCVSMLESFTGSEQNSEGAVTEQLRDARAAIRKALGED